VKSSDLVHYHSGYEGLGLAWVVIAIVLAVGIWTLWVENCEHRALRDLRCSYGGWAMNQPPVDYAVCTGARIIRNALRHLLKRISEGHGTPAETFALLWESRKAAWQETLGNHGPREPFRRKLPGGRRV
jgi:hypothetical protein